MKLPALLVEYVTTADDELGPMPPLGTRSNWRIVKRANGQTVWRRISLSTTDTTDPGDAADRSGFYLSGKKRGTRT